MIGLFFIYGLAFFSLGFGILLYPRKESKIGFAKNLGLIAAFGIFHGIHEWIDMFLLIHGGVHTLQTIRFAILPASFFFLVWYGSETLTEHFKAHRSLRYLPFILIALWISFTVLSRNRFLMGDIWARYLLCLPGSLLTAHALQLHRKELRKLEAYGLVAHLNVAAITFLVYGLLAGLTVPKAEVSPAFLWNDVAFRDGVGIPVQWFRAICAVALSYSLVRVLSIFQWETTEAMQRSLAELDWRVDERTGDLRRTNERLQREIFYRRETQGLLNAALQQAEKEKAKAEAVIEAIGDGISIQNRNLEIVYQNQTHQNMFGNRSGESCYEAYHLTDRGCSDCPVKACFSDGKIHRSERRVQTDTGIVHYEIIASPLRDSKGDIFAGIELIRDITERKRMEEELLKTEKLESLGLLAGGIAHDFNNLLTGILANLDLAKLHLERNNFPYERLVEAEKASLRAKDLVKQLSTFAKGESPIKKATSVGDLLRESAPFVLAGSNVRCAFEIPDDLWVVHADKGQLSQVIQNLIINADQAMPRGGTIEISARNVNIRPEDELPLPLGNYIKITIIDQGTGIEAEHIDKMFDPYFTTKEEGNGLGLTVAYSIVKKHDGFIMAVPNIIGTSFHIYLPASQSPAETPEEVEVPDLMGRGKILVMDDEAYVRSVAGEILMRLGYEVVSAQDGADAVAQYAEALALGSPFDAVIVDLTVPGGMGGEETLKRLHDIDPNVRGIVASGYSNNPILANFRSFGFKGMIAKPFDVQELGEAVQKVLREAS
jgi:PAS domain S-box-containing protein